MATQEAPRTLPSIEETPFIGHVAAPVSPSTVLLAEDDEDLREVMTIFLEANGYKVVACKDGQHALTKFLSNTGGIDVLLTDIQMPGRSGIELARELVSLRPFLPVLIVSGNWIAAETSQEFKSRGWKHLSKPAGLPAILAALETLLRPASLAPYC